MNLLVRGGIVLAAALCGAACAGEARREQPAATSAAAAPQPGAPSAPDPALFAPLPLPQRPPAHAGREGATEGGGVVVTWEPAPDPIPLNAPFALNLRLRAADPASALPQDLAVKVDAGMPGHGHGMTVRPETTRNADGTFTAKGLLFHMPGAWEIAVKVTRGGIDDVARFAVQVP